MSKHVLDTVINIAEGIYKNDLISVMRLIQNLGIKIGTNRYNFCIEADERRVKYSELSRTDKRL